MELSKEMLINLVNGGGKKFRKTTKVRALKLDSDLTIDQRGVQVSAVAGDYLCLDAENEPYICSRSVFELTYVEVKRSPNGTKKEVTQ